MTSEKVFVASPEARGKAKQFRLIAILAWLIAIGGEIYAILNLLHNEKLTMLIVFIVVILILAIVGSWLWKKANRLDPASEKDKVRFFIQNQLGAIMGVLAFLPLVIFIFTNKDLDKKSKNIAGIVGVVALLVAGVTGIDFNPPSIEKYTDEINSQTDVLKKLNMDNDHVFWSKEGNKYHIYEDCQHIKGREGVSNGTVKQAWESKGISELCKTCEKRATKENNVTEEPAATETETSTETVPAETEAQ